MAVFGCSVRLRLVSVVLEGMHYYMDFTALKKRGISRAIVDADAQHNHCMSSLTNGEVY